MAGKMPPPIMPGWDGFDVVTYVQRSLPVPVLLVHGWPETKRVWWRVIEPLAAAAEIAATEPLTEGLAEADQA